jgi:hypothetical protein
MTDSELIVAMITVTKEFGKAAHRMAELGSRPVGVEKEANLRWLRERST